MDAIIDYLNAYCHFNHLASRGALVVVFLLEEEIGQGQQNERKEKDQGVHC